VFPFIEIIGKLGVVLFFVLSGFLITYLLLAEEKSFATISVKKFYLRRVLRIWPLYYLIIILAVLILPNISIFTLPGFGKNVVYSHLFFKLLLYTLLFPNLVLSLFGIIPYASHTWSIGTEEQYYLIWPVILRRFKKYRLLLMFFVIFIYIGIYVVLSVLSDNSLPYVNALKAFWSTFNIDCMAIGGIYAILLFQESSVLSLIRSSLLFYVTIFVVIALMIKGVYFRYFNYECYSFLFGIIILNFASNRKIKVSLENRVFNYLGTISYGLYMYHPICIVLAIAISIKTNFVSNWLIYPLSFILTIIMAALSYEYYETFFLNLKDKFSKILSGRQ
jgi:peptidoglycan/LPS O-acetylase OafA/YrhL